MAVTELGAGDEIGDERLEELYAPPRTGWCRANFVVSLDGAIEVQGRSGGLGGADDRRVFATLRALADVVLVGSGTVVAEGYGPASVGAAATARRRARGQAPAPPIAVLTARASLDPSSRLFTGDGPAPLVLTSGAADADRRRALSSVADVVICGDDGVDPGTALAALRDRGLGGVLCEGGPTVLTHLVTAGLLDELCLTHAAVLAGPGRGGLLAGDAFDEAVQVQREQVLAGDGLLFARYSLLHRSDGGAGG